MKMLMLATLLLSQMLAAAVDSSDTNLVVLAMQPPTLHPIHMSPESSTTETIRKGGVPKALSPTTNPSASPAAIIDITHETKTPSDTVGFDSIPTPMPTSQPSRSITNAPSPNPFSSPPSKETQQPITSNPAESPTSNPKKGGSRASDSDVQSIGFVRNQLFSPICTIYFPDKSILDEQSVSSFEDTAKRFVHDNLSKINLPIVIVNVKGVTIVSQVLSWKRPSRRLRAEGATTGLDVYFQIDVVATGYATKEELENSFQELFDSNNNLFQSSIDIAAASEDQFNLTQLTLVVAASCSGFVALMLTMSIFIWKKTGKGSKRQLSSPKPVKAKAKSSPKVKYPVQEARPSRRESGLVSDHVSTAESVCPYLLIDHCL
jgi:hypothetical protein